MVMQNVPACCGNTFNFKKDHVRIKLRFGKKSTIVDFFHIKNSLVRKLNKAYFRYLLLIEHLRLLYK